MGIEAQCINTLNVPFAVGQIPTKSGILRLERALVGWIHLLASCISNRIQSWLFPNIFVTPVPPTRSYWRCHPPPLCSCIMKNPSKGLWFPSFDLVMSIRWGRKEHSGGDLSALETPRVEVKPRSSLACPNHTRLKYRIWVALRQPGWEPNQCVFEWSLAGHNVVRHKPDALRKLTFSYTLVQTGSLWDATSELCSICGYVSETYSICSIFFSSFLRYKLCTENLFFLFFYISYVAYDTLTLVIAQWACLNISYFSR